MTPRRNACRMARELKHAPPDFTALMDSTSAWDFTADRCEHGRPWKDDCSQCEAQASEEDQEE